MLQCYLSQTGIPSCQNVALLPITPLYTGISDIGNFFSFSFGHVKVMHEKRRYWKDKKSLYYREPSCITFCILLIILANWYDWSSNTFTYSLYQTDINDPARLAVKKQNVLGRCRIICFNSMQALQDHLYRLSGGIARLIVSKEASRCNINCFKLIQALQTQLLPLQYYFSCESSFFGKIRGFKKILHYGNNEHFFWCTLFS